MVRVAAWCAVRHYVHGAHAIVRALTSSALSASASSRTCPTCGIFARSSSVAEQSWHTRSTNAPIAVSVLSASGVARSAASLAVPSAWVATAQNATRHSCWSSSSERRWLHLTEFSTAARETAMDMTLCLRRACISPSGLHTCPQPGGRRRAALAVSPDTLIPTIKSHGWPNSRGDSLA